jgi:hypothetical protein
MLAQDRLITYTAHTEPGLREEQPGSRHLGAFLPRFTWILLGRLIAASDLAVLAPGCPSSVVLMGMNNAATLAPMRPEDFRPARGTRRNTAALASIRALGRETAFGGLPRRVLDVSMCRECNAWLPAVAAAYSEGYDAGAAERAERLVRIASDRGGR